MSMAPPLRLAPERPFPPYSYVTGHFPHPLRDPRGHSFGHPPGTVAAIVPERWADSRDYLAAIDLFNHGYYWEAHEAWEQLWHAAGRRGKLADFLKGLIKLAAAGVKAREGRTDGVKRHAARAGELFAATREGTAPDQRFLGLNPNELIARASELSDAPPVIRRPRIQRQEPIGQASGAEVPLVEIVFDFVLLPGEESDNPEKPRRLGGAETNAEKEI